jgi:hypothetical protein
VTDKGIVIYGNFTQGIGLDTGSVVEFRQAIPGNFHGLPETYTQKVNSEITAIHGLDQYSIIFEERRCWRIEGTIDATGRGILTKKIISDDYGVRRDAGKSVVRVGRQLFFLSLDGFCYTDGFSVYPISKHLRTTFGTTGIQKQGSHTPVHVESLDRIQGVYSERQNRIYWNIPYLYAEGLSDEQNNCIVVLDLGKPLEPHGVFTLWPFEGVSGASAICVDPLSGQLLRADKYGYIYSHDDSSRTDPVPDSSKAYDNWNHIAVVPEYVSPTWSFGSFKLRKWVTTLHVLFENLSTKLGVQIYSANDKSETYTEMSPAVFSDATGLVDKVISRTVRFPRGRLRCLFKAIKMKRQVVNKYRGDGVGAYTVAATVTGHSTNQVTWGAGATLPPYAATGMRIYFEDYDDYETGFVITAIDSGARTLDFRNPNNIVMSYTDANWRIKAASITQKMKILGISIPYQYLGGGLDHRESGDSDPA